MPCFRFVLVAAALLLSCNPTGAPPAQPPRLGFTESTHDFGRAEQGAQLTHRFAFRNAGGLDLSIDNVRALCGCTTALTPARIIHPGEGGAIEVTWDTAEEVGRKTRTVTVYSNDPAQPVTALTVHADIDADVAADPPRLYVGHVRRGQTAASILHLIGSQPAAFAAVPIAAQGRVVDAIADDAPAGRMGRQLLVTVKRDAPIGPFKDALAIETRSTRRPMLTIPVTGVVDGDAADGAANGAMNGPSPTK